jgi:hypothetical protein
MTLVGTELGATWGVIVIVHAGVHHFADVVLCHIVCVHRVLFSTDQGFPLAAAFAYSVYQFQSKRVKRNPEGPFFGGNAMVGAIFSTLCCLAVACGVS